jgi:hypothetical protein
VKLFGQYGRKRVLLVLRTEPRIRDRMAHGVVAISTKLFQYRICLVILLPYVIICSYRETGTSESIYT